MEQLILGSGSGQRVLGSVPARSAKQATLRETNLRLVAGLIYSAPEPLSRAGIAALSGLTRSTASRLVDELVGGLLVTELEPVVASGPGRPAVPLVPARRTRVALGMEVNTGRLAVQMIDLSGEVLVEQEVEVDLVGSDPVRVLARLGRLMIEVRDRGPMALHQLDCALALPGLVEAGSGRLLQAPNLGWRDVHPAAHLGPRALADRALRVGNEAELAALSLAYTRPGRPGPHRDFVFVTAEVGIGGAIVVGGRVLPGSNGWAGEIGHLSLDPNGRPCRCGSRGCLEQYAGRAAVLEGARLPAGTTPTELAALADAGHPGARTALAAAGRALGVALAAVVNLLDIQTLLLGGDLAVLARHLHPSAAPELQRRVLSAEWAAPQIASATADAATGAAYQVLNRVLSDPARHL